MLKRELALDTGRRPERPARWTGWLVAAMAATVVLYGIDLVLHPLPLPMSGLFQKFASSAVFFGAVALCIVKGRASPGERLAWWLLALALGLWGSGSVYYSIFLWDLEAVPIPSIADALWLAFYPPAYAALCVLLRQRAGEFARGIWLDALVGSLGVGGASAALVFGVILDHTDGSSTVTAVNLAYPLGDLGLLALVVAAITVVGWKGAGVWRWIASAFAVFAVADSVWLAQVATDTYAAGLLDLGWPVAALLVGAGAWRREPIQPLDARRGTMIVVPAVFGLAALALLVAASVVEVTALAVVLASASILVMLLRLYLAVQENARLLAQSRREATTDALTGLGNRRQLAADLSAQLAGLDPDRPLTLTIFDLDGFKHYNDTFGHLPGDQLLKRLGARLAALVAERGTAYRMGGDEFCALWTRSGGSEPSLTAKEAVAALSEHGEGFAIGCSYGSVLLPNETNDPTEALRMADRRMYIRKRGGRVSAGRQSSDVLQRALAERDTELGIHVGGVAQLAAATAMQLGIAREDLEATHQTALLHDVGKVAIPDEILDKPGPLDAFEWAYMKRHTIIGERILSAAPALAEVAKLVRSTHERYDGGGYPDGLVGDATPLIARIVTVCDAYDAMVTRRAYRQAHEPAWAIAELRRCSGTQFDPVVVEALITALEAAVGREGAPADPALTRPAVAAL